MSDMRSPDAFAARMKGYEAVAQPVLMHRTPVIVRVDGKNFSRLTRGLEKPFDRRFNRCMDEVALRLVQEAQNARLAYVQSDEVSVLLVDFRTLTTNPWFDNQVQKICSIAAAAATSAFGQAYIEEFRKDIGDNQLPYQLPMFDARCFNLPREEVTNYFVWRQRDAERNSVAMTAQANFSHKELQGMNRVQMIEALRTQRGIDWESFEDSLKRGRVVTKEQVRTGTLLGEPRARWIGRAAPIFVQDRDSIERFLREEEVRVDAGH